MYPTELPDGVKIKSITKHEEDTSKYTLNFTSSSDSLSISVSNFYQNSLETIIDATIYKTENLEFYIKIINGNYMAIGQLSGYEYIIIFNNYDELIKIINNLKEV